jgi:SAM-dependent methyltransferase
VPNNDILPSSEFEPQLRRYRRQWEANAKLDPLWAVLSLDDKLGNGWNERAFFETGRQEIDEVFDFMRRNQMVAPQLDRALDFGCGLGRLTEPLASRARHVVGVDISAEMIRRARAYFPHLEFHLNERPDLRDFQARSVDLIYTNIVLQHLNTGLQKHYLREFGTLLRPGGLAILQIPSRQPVLSRKIRTLKMLASLGPRGVIGLLDNAFRGRIVPWRARMELNILPKPEVINVARACGLKLEAVGNINWKVFYTRNHFQLEPEANELDDQREFPLSHLYFFRKIAWPDLSTR